MSIFSQICGILTSTAADISGYIAISDGVHPSSGVIRYRKRARLPVGMPWRPELRNRERSAIQYEMMKEKFGSGPMPLKEALFHFAAIVQPTENAEKNCVSVV